MTLGVAGSTPVTHPNFKETVTLTSFLSFFTRFLGNVDKAISIDAMRFDEIGQLDARDSARGTSLDPSQTAFVAHSK